MSDSWTTPFSEELVQQTFGYIIQSHPILREQRRILNGVYRDVSSGKVKISAEDRTEMESQYNQLFKHAWVLVGTKAVEHNCQGLLKPAAACVAADSQSCDALFENFLRCAFPSDESTSRQA